MLGVEMVKESGLQMRMILGLSSYPVGVKFLYTKENVPNAEVLDKHRYCQALAKARNGQSVVLEGEGISCPAAASAFGFKPLPEGLKSGAGLVGFGIVSDPEVGRKMFQKMPKLESGKVQQIHLFPLEKAEYVPDIVVVEDEVEKLMWIVLAYMHVMGGERVQSSTVVLQATCVDAAVIPYLENRLNMSYGCYGCRDATDIGNNETVLGFPALLLSDIIEHLDYLNKKAIPNSRSKKTWDLLKNRGPELG